MLPWFPLRVPVTHCLVLLKSENVQLCLTTSAQSNFNTKCFAKKLPQVYYFGEPIIRKAFSPRCVHSPDLAGMSQSSFLGDVAQWSKEECRSRLNQTLPKLVLHFQEANDIQKQLEVLKIICLNFVPEVRCPEAEQQVFSGIAEKTKACFDENLRSLVELVATSQGHLQQVQNQAASFLQGAITVIECLEVCVKHLSQSGDGLHLCDGHSLPPAILHVLGASYSHCKESGSLYGELLSAMSHHLSALFKKAHGLQVAFVAFLDKAAVEATMQDEEDLVTVLMGFFELTQVALALDVKIMITLWKTLSRLACQHRGIICDRLDIATMLTSLSAEMLASFQFLLTLIPSPQSSGDVKSFQKNLKILGFQMKVLVMLVREYEGYLGNCVGDLYTLLLHLKSLSPPSSKGQLYAVEYLEQIQQSVTAATDPLMSSLINERDFRIAITRTDSCHDASLTLSRCLVIMSLMETIPRLSDSDLQDWLTPVVHTEDIPHASVVAALFSCIRACTEDILSPDCTVPGTMNNGKPQRNVTMFEQLCTCLCGFSASFPARHFGMLEEVLLHNVLDSNLHCALVSVNVWCFLARYGTADLCRDHSLILAQLLDEALVNPSAEWCHLVLLVRRMLRFLAPEHQDNFVREFPGASHIALWSVLPLSVLAPPLCESVLEGLVPACAKALQNWNEADIKTPGLAQKATAAMKCLHSIYLHEHLPERHVPPDLSAMVWENVFTALNLLTCAGIETYQTVEELMTALLIALSAYIPKMDNKRVLQVLGFSADVLPASSSAIKLSLLTFLDALGHKVLPPSNEQSRILHLIPLVFSMLLRDKNVVVKQHALETFAQFAETTVHESVVSETIASDSKLQEVVVQHLNQVANRSIPESDHASTHNEAVSLTSAWAMSPGERYPAVRWPDREDCEQARKKPRLSTLTPEEQESGYRRGLGQLRSGLQQLQQLASDGGSVPGWVLEEALGIHTQLGSMLR